jgi:hypothetical protein
MSLKDMYMDKIYLLPFLTGFDFFMLYRSLAETTTNLGVGLLHLGSVNFCPSVGPIWVRARSCIRDREFLFVV